MILGRLGIRHHMVLERKYRKYRRILIGRGFHVAHAEISVEYIASAGGSRNGCWHLTWALQTFGRVRGIAIRDNVRRNRLPVRTVSGGKRVPETVAGSTRKIAHESSSSEYFDHGKDMSSWEIEKCVFCRQSRVMVLEFSFRSAYTWMKRNIRQVTERTDV